MNFNISIAQGLRAACDGISIFSGVAEYENYSIFMQEGYQLAATSPWQDWFDHANIYTIHSCDLGNRVA